MKIRHLKKRAVALHRNRRRTLQITWTETVPNRVSIVLRDWIEYLRNLTEVEAPT